MHFDARAAKALQPGAHLTIDGCPGLCFEATQARSPDDVGEAMLGHLTAEGASIRNGIATGAIGGKH